MKDEAARTGFERQLGFANRHLVFKDCSYYPCHSLPESQPFLNCFFCYCPFYPCGVAARGGKWLVTNEKKIWDCSDCNWIHRDEITREIIELIYENIPVKEINRMLREKYHESNQ